MGAYALKYVDFGPPNAHFGHPDVVLNFIWTLAPLNVLGEIHEDAYAVDLDQFCSAMKIPQL